MKKGIFYSLLIFLLAVAFLKLSSNTKADFEASANLALPYSVIENYPDGTKSEIRGISTQDNIDGILSDLHIQKLENDRTQAFPELKMNIGSQITVNHAPVIFVKDGRKHHEYRSWTNTVEELFIEQGIEIGQDDKVNFPDDTILENNIQIVITRVAITNVQEKEPIDYKTIKKDDPNLDQGKTKVAQAGAKGEKTLTYLVRREDGEEVSRSLIKTETSKEPVEEILMIGTRPVITVRCKFNDTVIAAALKYGADANALCTLMMKESNGNPRSGEGSQYQGLFQYTDGFWKTASAKAGYAGASIFDPTAQIYATAWAVTHGERGRWPK